MQNLRVPLLLGLGILLLIGLIIGYLIMDDQSEGRLIAPPTSQLDDDSAPRRGDPTTLPRDDEAEHGVLTEGPDATTPAAGPREARPDRERPVARLVEIEVSGVAVDFDRYPESGVTLTLLPADAESTSGPTAVTDDAGRFHFTESLQPGRRYIVACLEDRRALTATDPFTAPEDEAVEGLEIQVFWAGRIHGVVLNGETNEPLEGVDIRVDARRDERLQRLGRLMGRLKPTVSDARGQFSMDHLAPGSFLALASKSGWAASEINPTTRDRQEVTVDEYSNVELLPFVLIQAGTVEGYILRASDREPIPGASVELGTPLGGTTHSTTADERGFYRFDSVPPQQGGPGGGMAGTVVRALAPGYAVTTRNLRVGSGQTRSDFNLMLRDGTTVEGVVLSDRREPIAGAQVYMHESNEQQATDLVSGMSIPPRTLRTTTDESGRFTLNNVPPGGAPIGASAEGYAPATVQAATSVEDTARVEIILPRAGVLSGVITNEFGQPVSGVPVAAYDVSGPGMLAFIMRSFFGEALPDRGESTLVQSEVRSNEDGFYELTGLQAGKYVLIANTWRYQKYMSPELEIRTGAVTEHNVTLASGGRIFGRIYDGQGRTVSGAAVTASAGLGGENIRVRTVYSDRGGNYEITGLQPGTYTVVRNDGSFASLVLPRPSNQVSVRAGESSEFDLYEQKPGTARLYGRVFLDGEPYADSQISLFGGNLRGFGADTTRTDANGNYEFRSVALGMYQIAQSGGMMPSLVRQRIYVDRAGDMQVDVEFVTVTISGRVRLESGEVPTGRVRVMASPVNPDDRAGTEENVNELEMMVFREATPNRETGEFEITGLSPGFYRVTARASDHGMVTLPAINARSSVSGLALTLPTEGATLRGTVTGLDDAENNTPFGLIAALTIEDDRGQPLALGGFDNGVNLSQSKEFAVGNLAEGTFTVTLSVAGYTPVTFSGVQLRNGEEVSLTFAFAPAGGLRITLENDDIDIATAMGIEYEIRNSRGELFKKRFTFLDFFANDSSATQDADTNSFVITDLPPEDYTITINLPGYRQVRREFTVIAGATADISVRFQAE
jgi:large repetitive protein